MKKKVCTLFIMAMLSAGIIGNQSAMAETWSGAEIEIETETDFNDMLGFMDGDSDEVWEEIEEVPEIGDNELEEQVP